MDSRIEEWRAFLSQHRAQGAVDMDDLCRQLDDQARRLVETGLDEEEAFLLATRRIASSASFSPGLAREHAKWLAGRLAVAPGDGAEPESVKTDMLVAIGLAVAAAAAFRLPELFGIAIEAADGVSLFYFRNFGLFVFPFIVLYFAWKRAMPPRDLVLPVLAFVAGLVAMNAYPFTSWGHTVTLAGLHLVLALWLTMGYVYAAARWRDHERRLAFVRFSGEWFIQYVLIALGGGVFVLATVFIFDAIGLDAEHVLVTWIIPCGVVGAVVVAAALVDARVNLAGNMAPVLTLLFTPLFTLALLAFLAVASWTGSGIRAERELLIGFDLLLVLVLGLVLYSISARDPGRRPGFFDALQLVLLLSALSVDALALWAMLGRISEFGLSPNRVAGLGLNLVLVVNLAGAAVLHARFLAGRSEFIAAVRWQTAYLTVYLVWAWFVVLALPPMFGFA